VPSNERAPTVNCAVPPSEFTASPRTDSGSCSSGGSVIGRGTMLIVIGPMARVPVASCASTVTA
jgi:hypothetical protein